MKPTQLASSFHLPQPAVFGPDLAQYPNLWLYFSTQLAASYEKALELGRQLLSQYCGVVPFPENPVAEGCDEQWRRTGLQLVRDPAHPELDHYHQLHLRYYWGSLRRQGMERVKLETHQGFFYRLAVSGHYEVPEGHPLHPTIEFCPACGRVGEYAVEVDRRDLHQDMCLKVHDPLGLELLLGGKIRGQPLAGPDGAPVRSLADLARQFTVDITVFATGALPWINTPRVGCVVIRPR
ncbi:MAG: hypothetical protein HY335_02445 [Deinococcus sp.]|nr:hypothetical protein [Deinococcus sp.]